jgi:hypothetical protein
VGRGDTPSFQGRREITREEGKIEGGGGSGGIGGGRVRERAIDRALYINREAREQESKSVREWESSCEL